MSLVNNTTELPDNRTILPRKRNEELALIEVAVLSLALAMSLVGNAVVVLVLRCKRKRLSRMQWFIINLCVADLAVGFFNILPQLVIDVMGKFPGNDFACRFIKYSQVAVLYASSNVLVMTTVDRYLSICHPLKTHSWRSRYARIMIVVAWTVALVLATPQAVIFKLQPHQVYNITGCYVNFSPEWTLQLYVTQFVAFAYIIPLIIIVFSYVCICKAVWLSASSHRNKFAASNRRSVENSNESISVDGKSSKMNQKTNKSISNSKIKTIKLTLTIVLCFIICWSPWSFCQLWSAFDPSAPYEGAAMVIISLLPSLNSCNNPWIYFFFSGFALVCKKERIAYTSSGYALQTNRQDSLTRTSNLSQIRLQSVKVNCRPEDESRV